MNLHDAMNFIREHTLAQHALGAATLLLLTVMLYVTTVVPMQHRELAIERLAAQVQDQQGRQLQLERSRRLVEQQLQQANAKLAATPIAFDSPRAINEQLARLAELGGWSGLTIETIDPGRTVSGQMLATQTIRMTGRGSFGAVHTFMRVLREETPETSVTTFSLAATAGETTIAGEAGNPALAGDLRFEMELLWYSQPDAAKSTPSTLVEAK